jgi:endo-1,4-beta-xylanase
MKIPRRDFLKTSTAMAAGALLPSALRADDLGEDAAPPTTRPEGPSLRVRLREFDNSFIELERYRTCHARDLANDPLPLAIHSEHRTAVISLAKEPIQVTARLKVPEFGEVYCVADNGARGYSADAEIDFVHEAAATRQSRVRELLAKAKQELAPIDDQTLRYVGGAARATPDLQSAYTALADGLHAGERLALARANNRISRFAAPRKDFKFGCMISPYATGQPFSDRVTELFNFATASWYTWKDEEPVEKRIDYARMDGSLQWCWDRHITPKGFGYCYMTGGATPEWIRSWPFEKVLAEYVRVVRQTMARYAGKLEYAEIMNEAHDKANLWKLSHEQVLQIAKAVFDAAREGSPSVKRQMNHCCLWAEYGKNTNPDGVRRWSPWQFVRDCFAHGVDYEIIGLQLYYPQYDLMEIERMLDRFAVFNKPLHITEIATASKDGLDPRSMRPNTAAPGWHGPWSESTQADWMQGVYTLCYSKPQFEAIGWWDLGDKPGHFWPYGGMLHDDLSPKESYTRLEALQKSWGLR